MIKLAGLTAAVATVAVAATQFPLVLAVGIVAAIGVALAIQPRDTIQR